MQRDAPNLPGTRASGAPEAPSLRDRAGGVIAFAIALTLLYVGRDVLIPLTLALMLSLLIAPLVAGQVVEPNLYGHTTGLSPLSVVVAAIFWSSLWGPAGLILSTPLTLCLLVLGRHIKGLGFLELLLGDAQALTLPQKFYQRALSGDSHEIIANARAFLKQSSFAAYCDRVVMPARLRQLFPRALLVDLLLPGVSDQPDSIGIAGDDGRVVTSFVQALQFCLQMEQHRARPD
jgi:hypothetical protein